MIQLDVHTHTRHSHGKDSVEAMFARANALGLEVYGFSEHSPRPDGYSYKNEYREHLADTFDEYIQSVLGLQRLKTGPRALLGLELDYLPEERHFMREAAGAAPFDYLIGGIHFLDHWGFDEAEEDWLALSREETFERYTAYFATVGALGRAGLVHILAHPDIIKIFTPELFHQWIGQPSSRELVGRALEAVKAGGLAMEVSSAGLRKPCGEIYPCPAIMEMASSLGLPISFASDAHRAGDICYGFDSLEAYARRYGYAESVFFQGGKMHSMPF